MHSCRMTDALAGTSGEHLTSPTVQNRRATAIHANKGNAVTVINAVDYTDLNTAGQTTARIDLATDSHGMDGAGKTTGNAKSTDRSPGRRDRA